MRHFIFKNFLTFSFLLIIFTSLFSCKKDEKPFIRPPKPTADFTTVADAETGLKVTFTNTSEYAKSYAWDFGVTGATSTAKSPEYSYTADGTYTVTLVVTSVDGSTNTKSKTLVVKGPVPQDLNLLENGNFVNAENWTRSFVLGEAGDIEAIFNNGLSLSTAADEATEYIFQEIELEAGTYEIAMDLDVDDKQENALAGVYISPEPPVVGVAIDEQYSVIGFHSFGGCKQSAFAGDVKTLYPDNQDCLEGQFIENGRKVITEAGKYYFVILTGVEGGSFGDNFNIKSVGLTKVVQ